MGAKLKTVQKYFKMRRLLQRNHLTVNELKQEMNLTKEGVYTYLRTLQQFEESLKHTNNKYFIE